jgi:hypothetical protein
MSVAMLCVKVARKEGMDHYIDNTVLRGIERIFNVA